jgi:hypothetical protein
MNRVLLKQGKDSLLLLLLALLLGVGLFVFARVTGQRREVVFGLKEVCKIKVNSDVTEAWETLGKPPEVVNYDFGEYLEVQYSSKQTSIQIIYRNNGMIQQVSIATPTGWQDIRSSHACPPQ